VRLTEELKPHCHGLALEASFPPRTYLFRLLEEGETVNDETVCQAIQSYQDAHQADRAIR